MNWVYFDQIWFHVKSVTSCFEGWSGEGGWGRGLLFVGFFFVAGNTLSCLNLCWKPWMNYFILKGFEDEVSKFRINGVLDLNSSSNSAEPQFALAWRAISVLKEWILTAKLNTCILFTVSPSLIYLQLLNGDLHNKQPAFTWCVKLEWSVLFVLKIWLLCQSWMCVRLLLVLELKREDDVTEGYYQGAPRGY